MKSEPQVVKIPCVGYEIVADWYEGTNDSVWLVLPGFTSSRMKYRKLITESTIRTGASALVIDYSGHGDSPFQINDMTRAQNFSEAVKAFDWLAKHKAHLNISVHGTSYGGFHTAYLTKFREFNDVIFRVPASYPEETLYSVIGEMEDAHSRDYRKNPDNYINHWLFTHTQSVKGRRLVVTHELDDICPDSATSPFIEAFQADHIEAKGLKHGFAESNITKQQENEYYNRIADWISQ